MGGDISRLEARMGERRPRSGASARERKKRRASKKQPRQTDWSARAAGDGRQTTGGRRARAVRCSAGGFGGQAGRRAGGRVGGCLEGLPRPAETHN